MTLDDLATASPGELAALGLLVVLSIGLWIILLQGIREHGGGVLAGLVVTAGLAGLLLVVVGDVLPFDLGLMALLASIVVIRKPDLVIGWTGGPRLEWRALREGRELILLARDRTGDEEAATLVQRVADLDGLEAPATTDYLAALRAALATGRVPDGVPWDAAGGRGPVWGRLAEEDERLRSRLPARPSWERAMERRARGEEALPAG